MQEYIKKILRSGRRHSSSASHNHPSSKTLMIPNNEMEVVIKIVKSLEDSGLLLKWVTEEQKGGFLSMLLGTLDVSLLGNISTERGINRANEGVIKAGYENNKKGKK